MIEAPEALLLAEQINENISGKKIVEVIAGHSPHKFVWFYGDYADYPGRMHGKTVGAAVATGGMVSVRVGDHRLVFCDGVNLRYKHPCEEIHPKHQLLLGFDDDSCLTASVRMYGAMMCIPADTHDYPMKSYIDSAAEKPQLMGPDFTREYFLSVASTDENRKVSAKAFLATQQRFPGLGNGILQDILYKAGIHPKTKIAALSCSALSALYDSVCDVTQEIYRQGGRSSESDIFGRPGRYRAFLSKDTAGEECTRCGEVIRKENYLGGSIYYCPGCQPVVK